MQRSYRPIRSAAEIDQSDADTTDGGRGPGAVVMFIVGTLGGVAAVGALEWKSAGGGPQTATGQVAAAPDATPDPGAKLQTRQKLATQRPSGGMAVVQARPVGATGASKSGGRTSSGTAARPASATPPRSASATPPRTRNAAPRTTPAAPPSASPSAASVKIARVLVGADALKSGQIPEPSIREHADSDRYLVYFELSVPTASAGQRLSYDDFRLEDASGLIYTPIKTSDAFGASTTSNGATRGGVAFAVYNDSAPARLLVRTNGERFVPLPENVFRGSAN